MPELESTQCRAVENCRFPGSVESPSQVMEAFLLLLGSNLVVHLGVRGSCTWRAAWPVVSVVQDRRGKIIRRDAEYGVQEGTSLV